MAGRVAAGLAGERTHILVGPQLTWHAARLEQVAAGAMLQDADVAVRALRTAQALYGLDVVFASTVESVACALRGLGRPRMPLGALMEEQRLGLPLPGPVESEAVADSAGTTHAAALVERMKSLMPRTTDIGLVIPTAQSLSESFRGTISVSEADEVCGAFLRTVGAIEPDLVLRVGDGERGAVSAGTCGYFGIPLIEIGDVVTDGVALFDVVDPAPRGENTWLYVTAGELPAAADAKTVTDAVARLKTK